MTTIVCGIHLCDPRVATSTSGQQQAQCSEIAGWEELRDELGGTYLQNGWQSQFPNVLLLTAIGGQLQGSLHGQESAPDGRVEQSTMSVTGLFDAVQISLRFDTGLGSVTAIGAWSDEGILVSWPTADGSLVEAWFQPAREAVVADLLERWPDHDVRTINADLAIGMMERVAVACPYKISGPERDLATNAASFLGLPEPDPITLLLAGWLASVQYSEHNPELLPNQSNWYTVHTFSRPAEAILVADCVRQQWVSGWEQQELDLPHGAIAVVHTSGPGEYGAMSLMLAIHGSNLIVVSTYGGEEMIVQGLGTLTAIVSEIGEFR